MNIKINTAQHHYLCSLKYKEYIFGSKLHGIATENSDSDYIRVIDDSFYDNFKTEAKYLPNIHSWQYDDIDNNTQYVWMTKKQFYHNLFSGDGNMVADVVLLSGEFKDSMFLCRTYKIIKGYLGVAKRDLRIHGNLEKKRFHALRSIYMVKCLMDNTLPNISGIKNLKTIELPLCDELFEQEKEQRNLLNTMFNNKLISTCPEFKEDNPLAQIMLDCNNIGEFKY